MVVSIETARRRSTWASLLLCNSLSPYPTYGWSVDYTATTEIFHPSLNPANSVMLRSIKVRRRRLRVSSTDLRPTNSPVLFKQNQAS